MKNIIPYMPSAIKWVTPSSNVKLFPKFIFSPLCCLALQIQLVSHLSVSLYAFYFSGHIRYSAPEVYKHFGARIDVLAELNLNDSFLVVAENGEVTSFQ